MSRVKSRAPTVCGDCGASDPSWASINRGILLCAECCSVHRSLGRHISQVKSMRQGKWTPSVLNFVNTINATANNVWEHYIMDLDKFPKNMRRNKPSPKDPLHPNKTDFIRAKHVQLAFVLKPSIQDNGPGASLETELSKQLHASVRAPNLETSLRLLVQGADPNYFHEEKGSTPLHMAAKSGQADQVELLLVYGADIQTPDSQNQTAIDLAKANNHLDIADRLGSALYEVTDRLCYFLCNRKPDHAANQHIIIPEQNGIEITEQLKIARGKLLLIPNKMFEELVMDLYDEVDRRETEAIWSTSALNPEIGAVPFLPANPILSATRNQGRQKLARFSPAEFSGLLTDVLIDAKRRQNMANLRPLNEGKNPSNINRCSNLSDDEPLYDAVASDDDYAALAPVAQQAVVNQSPINTRSSTEMDTLKKQLQEQQQVINKLQNQIERLASENNQLKSKIKTPTPDIEEVELRTNGGEINGDSKQQQQFFGKRPVSMYEQRERPSTRINNIPDSRAATSMYHMAKELKEVLPLNEEVIRYTETVTRRIQELVKAMQDLSVAEVFVPCSDRIQMAVTSLCTIFPSNIEDESINAPLKQLTDNASEMQIHCANLEKSLSGNQSSESNLTEIHQCAYNLARANKDLVTRFTF